MHRGHHIAWVAAVAALVGSVLACSAAAQVPADQQERIRAAVPGEPRAEVDQPRKVLIWSRAVGFRHSSIPHGAFAMKAMGEKTGAWEATETTDLRMLMPDKLHEFDALILNNTTGDWIRPREEDLEALGGGSAEELEAKLRQSVLDFVANGGGLVGYHSASDSNYHWDDFGRLIGGYFNHHPWHEEIGVSVEEGDHTLCACFDGDFRIVDEIYQFKDPYSRNRLRVLLSMDTGSSDMNKDNIERTDNDFAIAWTRTYGEGRVFYSSLGHREEIFWNPTIMQFYRDGIQYALGDLDADALPSNVVEDEGYVTLFDGSHLDYWNYAEDGWEIADDGSMALNEEGGYIWTKGAYEDFILDVSFKISEEGNSGIFFRTDPADPVQAGFEVQVLDTAGKANEELAKYDGGSLYDAAEPLTNAMKPAGEWNRLILVCEGPVIYGILNDQVVIDVNIDHWETANLNPDGSENKFDTALKDLPRRGHIGFQDHGDAVWYRDIRIKPLD